MLFGNFKRKNWVEVWEEGRGSGFCLDRIIKYLFFCYRMFYKCIKFYVKFFVFFLDIMLVVKVWFNVSVVFYMVLVIFE